MKKNFLDTALEYYKKALDFEKVYPNVLTDAYLAYAELVVKLQRKKLLSLPPSPKKMPPPKRPASDTIPI